MRKEVIGNATLYLGKMEETIGGPRFDHIITDPPYLYIKTHDFDKEFDEQLLFENAKRILPDNGFIALFGRGTSFYRWNTRLAELGLFSKKKSCGTSGTLPRHVSLYHGYTRPFQFTRKKRENPP